MSGGLFKDLVIGEIDISPALCAVSSVIASLAGVACMRIGARLIRRLHLQGMPELQRRRFLRRSLINRSSRSSRSKFKGAARCFRQRWAL